MLENTEQEMPDDFTEMYLKTFGTLPKIGQKTEEAEETSND